MSTNLTQTSNDFDCSVYLSHGLTWPVDECSNKHDWVKASASGYKRDEYHNHSKSIKVPASFCHQRPLNEEDVSSILYGEKSRFADAERNMPRTSGDLDKFSEEQYYENEYTSLLKWIDDEEIIVPPPSQFADKREEIRQISQLADQALHGVVDYDNPFCHNAPQCSTNMDHGRKFANLALEAAPCPSKERCLEKPSSNNSMRTFTCKDLANEVATKVIETPRTLNQGMSPGTFQNFVEEQLTGFGESNEKREVVFRKRRLCRHFVKGFCLRGDSCDFLHDHSFFCTDEQKVFLGGLPQNLTPGALKSKLEKQGLRILNKPRVMRGFSPQVCLGSVEEARRLVSQGSICIDGHNIDVRPYKDKDQLRKGLPSVVKRSVFLGGLPEDTTTEMIVSDLQRLDVKVVQCPIIKDGYAPRVVLDSVESRKMLVSLKRIMVNGTVVDVRPYVNFRKRY